MEAANPFVVLANESPQSSKLKSKKRKKRSKKKIGITNEEQTTNPHATVNMTPRTLLPPKAETFEVIQKHGIRQVFGSILLAPVSVLYLLLRLFYATIRCLHILFSVCS
jgi:hypothetical protein